MDEGTEICKHPADFTLFEIGEYDGATGVMIQSKESVALGNGLEFKSRATNAQVADLKKVGAL